MSIEDRVRDATRARTDLVGGTRPLDLPLDLPARPSARATRDRGRRWLSWGAPLAAAAVIAALAVTLALVRQAGDPHPAPAAPPAPASVPRYYAVLVSTGSSGTSPLKLVVGDDQTGRTLAVVNPSARMSFYGVTGAADDRTFVLANFANQETTWYLLRLDPGAAHPVQLRKLPIAPAKGQVRGLALSTDGRELAVMGEEAGPSGIVGSPVVTRLAVYSVSSGAVLHSWSTESADGGDVTGANADRLSWVNGDRSLDFRWGLVVAGAFHTLTVRTIGLTAAGTDLLAGSRVALTVPDVTMRTEGTHATYSLPCASSLAAQDGTIVCGSAGAASAAVVDACAAVPPSLVSYPGTTGKRLKTLYQYQGRCFSGSADVLWTDSGGRHVIFLLMLQLNSPTGYPRTEYGLVSSGRLTLLPQLVLGSVTTENGLGLPGRFAF